MTELRLLETRVKEAVAFWIEAEETFSSLYFINATFIFPRNGCKLTRNSLMNTFKRIIRFLFCFSPDFIVNNVVLIDAYLLM